MTHASRQMSSLQCRIVHQQFARAVLVLKVATPMSALGPGVEDVGL